jgi:hypothetical protein
MIQHRATVRAIVGLVSGLAFVASATAAPISDERASYSYVRTLEGRATLASHGQGPGDEAEIHQPLQQGDRIRVERGARVEIVLADRNLLFVGGGSSLQLTRVAFSADRDDRTTRLDLDEGEILLVVTEEALGDELPEIRTASGQIFVHEPGRYLLRADRAGGLTLLVREGYAEILTERGSTVVRASEEARTRGDHWGSIEVGRSGGYGALELWSDQLDRQARQSDVRELRVAPHLAYAAAPLARHGTWVNVEADWYWQPRVASGWRPYWDGRWAWTPSGLHWVSYEPWGWVPYHYGTWCQLAGYGWVWRPGYVYSPAWVYWYVGPSWTGWVPIGYYTHFYRPYWRVGFHFGVYGWTGGSWGYYSHWNFLPTRWVCDRRSRPWRRSGHDLARTLGGEAPTGILTTDTRGVPRDGFERPADLVRTLSRSPLARSDERGLPVVTDFVARRPELAAPVARAVLRDERTPGRRFATPLDESAPGAATRTAGRGPEAAGEARPLHRVGARDDGASARSALGASPRRAGTPALPDAGVRSGAAARRDELPGIRTAPSAPRDRAPAPLASRPDDRQAWRQREGVSDRPSTIRPPAERPALAPGSPSATPRVGSGREPVTRVIDGVRRSQPDARPAPRAGAAPAAPRSSPPAMAPRAAVRPESAPLRAAPTPRGPSGPATRAAPSPGALQRSAPPPSTRVAPAPRAPASATAPPPTVRPQSPAPATRSAPAPNSSVRTAPSQAPTARSTPAQPRARASNPPPSRGGSDNRSKGSSQQRGSRGGKDDG